MAGDTKAQMARQAASSFLLRSRVDQSRLPLHGIIGMFGPPGTGKTTLARGLADQIARLSKAEAFLFVEIDAHELTSSALGRSQKAVNQLLREQIPQWAADGPVVVFADEVETLAASRHRLSLESNPVDVHRATDAALVGIDHVARMHKNVLFLVTSNFEEAVDTALVSRLDLLCRIPLPNRDAVEAILKDTIVALADAFPGAQRLATDPGLQEVASAAVGLDGRQVRKLVATACSFSGATAADPGRLAISDLLRAAKKVNRP